MSDSGSSSSYNFGLEDPQWLCMVTLFIVSLLTLALYFAQYFQLGIAGKRQGAAKDGAAEEEAAALLRWALSLGSLRSQWRGAWCKALNEESNRRRVSLATTCLQCVAGDTKKKVFTCMNHKHVHKDTSKIHSAS